MVPFGCNSDLLETKDVEIASNILSQARTFNIDQELSVNFRSGPTKIELGEKRENPYSPANLQKAYENLYNHSWEVPITHKYVVFNITDVAQITRLAETDLVLFDYPLEYEVKVAGDYYWEPQVTGDLPKIYTVVERGYNIRNLQIPFEVISDLNLEVENDEILREAYAITNNQWDGPNRSPCHRDCPNWPDCFDNSALGCSDDDGGSTPPCNEDCSNAPCIPTSVPCNTSNPPSTTTNDCGCTIPSNDHYPAGCVRVFDTQAGGMGMLVPLRRVTVVARNNFFTIKTTQTNDQGCWRIDKEFKGKVVIKVKFKNDGTKMRAGDNILIIATHAFAYRHVAAELNAPPYNNLQINYQLPPAGLTLRWNVATYWNGLVEYQDLALEAGMLPAPKLDIYVGENLGGSFAIMNRYIEFSNGVTGGLLGSNHFLGFLANTAIFNFYAASELMELFAPDVGLATGALISDRRKRLCFHEYAHTSHWRNVDNNYWHNLIAAEVHASQETGDPHSNVGISPNQAGYIAVAESWAEFVGRTFAHEMYGMSHSLSLLGFTSWLDFLERTRNELPSHVPIGLFHDAMDPRGGEPESFDLGGGGSGIVNDVVTGFSIQTMYAQLDQDISSFQALQLSFLNNSSGNTLQQINNLFGSY